MFHFTGYHALTPIYSGWGDQVWPWPGYPIRKSPDQSVFAALRSLSQLITSFIVCWHQGIHHVLLLACFSLETHINFSFSSNFYIRRLQEDHLRSAVYLSINPSRKMCVHKNERSVAFRISFYSICSYQRTVLSLHLGSTEHYLDSRCCFIVGISATRWLWWVWQDSNLWPPPYQGGALTSWATDPLTIYHLRFGIYHFAESSRTANSNKR